jgi:hypothetical protein
LKQNIREELVVAFKIVLGVLVAVIIMWFQIVFWQPPVPDNCWSHYDTEQSAIEHCETHG